MVARRLVGGNAPTEIKRRPTPWYLLRGDVSHLMVPLCDPVRKVLEEFAGLNTAAKIVKLWQVALAQADDPDDIGYEPYPETDDDLHEIYTGADGAELPEWPWTSNPSRPRPENWTQLFETWYRTQKYFGMRELVAAFGEAMEAVTGLPLVQFAPLLALWQLSEGGGADGSPPKPASPSTTTPTGPKSGRRSTTSPRKKSAEPPEPTGSPK